jgi:hypothetical protein
MSADPSSIHNGLFKFDVAFDIVPVLFRFEPPDIVVARPSRSPTPDEMAVLGSFFNEARNCIGGVFVLSVLSGEIKRIGSAASMDMNRQVSTGMVKATAIVGADFHMRAAAETQMRAARALKLDFAKVLVEFFDNEASARAWFDKLRDASVDAR